MFLTEAKACGNNADQKDRVYIVLTPPARGGNTHLLRDGFAERRICPYTAMTFHAPLEQTLGSQREHVVHLVFVSRWMRVLAGENPVICTDCGEEVG